LPLFSIYWFKRPDITAGTPKFLFVSRSLSADRAGPAKADIRSAFAKASADDKELIGPAKIRAKYRSE
jgi:hypothetical protein